MNNLTDWIKYELYPSLYERINIAFPEHNFKQRSNGWMSQTYLNGSPHKSKSDKTNILKKAPGIIFENGGEFLSLVDYVMKRDRVEFIQAVETLARVAGLQLPKMEMSPESYQRYKDQATLLEESNSYFIYCLQNSPGAEDVRTYLSSRGYSDEDLKAMELGYIPSQEKLYKHLLSKGYSQSLIDEVIKLNAGIGSTHRLTIPYRSGGSVKGFKFRTVGEATPKYLNSTGLDRMGGFFNLSGVKGSKDVVIVEGELDSLHATVKGVENVVATGGSSIGSEQIKDAVRRGAKKFTLCFDNEPGKEEEASKRINTAIEVILGEEVNRVYIATLPDLGGAKTDPDKLIKEAGVGKFKEAIAQALPYYDYLLQEIFKKYAKLQDERELTHKDIDNLQDEVVEIASKIQDPTDRDRYKKRYLSREPIKEMGITEESLSITLDKLTSTRDKIAQAKEFKKLLSEATQLQDKGEVAKALELLDSRVKEVKITGARDLLPPPLSFSTLMDEIALLSPAYKTGYRSLDKFIGFTPGAITLIAGRPSHGKTTFMFNLLIQMSNLYQDERFYFITYEEPVKNISVKLLNRLTDANLSGYYYEIKGLPKPTNYEFLKDYIRRGRSDIKAIETGKKLLRELIDSRRIVVIDKNYSVEELSSLVAYLNKREKIGALIIDYIQRMRTERKTQDKRTEIAHISDSVLQIAKESGLPLILGAQLNRASTSSGNKKPSLENLKEAGNLEEDANTVISVYCEARETEETETGEKSSKQRTVELEFKTLKNREGEVNTVESLDWDRWTGVIKERSKEINSIF